MQKSGANNHRKREKKNLTTELQIRKWVLAFWTGERFIGGKKAMSQPTLSKERLFVKRCALLGQI